ncbi:MAG: hypothetical protein ACREFJ_04255 [Acetobacteraceae bacterium]
MSGRNLAAGAPPAPPHWWEQRERGSLLLQRLMIWIAFHLGWPAARALLVGITAYFFVTSACSRRASAEFLRRATSRPARMLDVFRHLHAFAATLLESTFLLARRTEHFRITVEGLDMLIAALAKGRGSVLLGAHFGSFEVLRAVARDAPVAVHPVMYRRATGRLARTLAALDPALAAAIIDLGTPEAVLSMREAVQRGEIVAMLADRTVGTEKRVSADFLGAPAEFPAGPLIVTAHLDAPVLLFWGIRTGPRRYTVVFEPFAERIVLRRGARADDLRLWVGRYAAKLEARCRANPFNWFNFFPFWHQP